MGNYAIIIIGRGIHHNTDDPNDADKLAMELSMTLRKAGHSLNFAWFVSDDGIEDLQ